MAHVIVGHPTSGFGGYERIAGRGLFFAGGFTELVDLTAAQQAALVSRGYTVDGQPDPPVADPWPQYMTSPEVRTLVMTDEEILAAQRAAFARPKALAKLDAGLASSKTGACNIVGAGSSTLAGSNATAAANRYFDLLIAAAQAAFPAPGGIEAPTIANSGAVFGTISTAPGVHGYNAGEGGTTSANYLTTGEIANIGALNPRAVIHMVGSNDYATAVPVATYKANVQAKIAGLKAATAGPCVHILVQSYARWDVTPAIPWSAYGAALREIADADPDNVAFLDLTADYAIVGVPGADPLNLIDTDNIHQTDAGHRLMASLLRRLLGLLGTRAGAASAGARTLARGTSDSFSGADAADIVGRTADAALGGSARTWAGVGTGFALSSGGVVKGSGSGAAFAGLPEVTPNVEVASTLTALPASEIYLDIHRASFLTAGSPNAYRLSLLGTAAVLRKRVSGTITDLSSTISITAGDRLALRYYNGTLEVRRNGALVASATDSSIPAAGYAGFATGGGATGFVLDNFTIDAVTATVDAGAATLGRSTTGVFIPGGWGSIWRPKLAAASAGGGKATVAVVGDSISAGYFASDLINKGYVGLLRAALQAAHGDGGSGFFSVRNAAIRLPALVATYGSQFVQLTGTWVESGLQDGPGMTAINSVTAGSTATKVVRGSRVGVWYLKQPAAGTFTVSVDGAAAVSVNAAGAQGTAGKYEVTGLTSGEHTIVVTKTGTTRIDIHGFFGENNSGVLVNNFSGYGASSINVVETAGYSNPGEYSGGWRNPADLVIYAMGANDSGANVTGDAYAANVRAYLDLVRDTGTATGNTEILFVLPHLGKFDSNEKGDAYALRMRGMAEHYGAAFINMNAIFRNSWNYFQTLGGWGVDGGTNPGASGNDPVHLSDVGDQLYADVLAPIVTSTD